MDKKMGLTYLALGTLAAMMLGVKLLEWLEERSSSVRLRKMVGGGSEPKFGGSQ